MSINFTSSQAVYRSSAQQSLAQQWQTPSNDSRAGSAQTPIGKLLSQLDTALQDPSANASSTLDDLLDTLSNSDDPVLQDMAAQVTDDESSEAADSGDDAFGTDASAQDTLDQLVQALTAYDQASQAQRGDASGRGSHAQEFRGADLSGAGADLYY